MSEVTTAWEVLAHQGGWDEILILLAPLAVFVALRWASSRREGRVTRQVGDVERGQDPSPPGPASS